MQNSSFRLSVVGLFVSLGLALVDTIWSVYLDSFLQSMALVGLVSGGLTLLSILCFFFFTPILERVPEARLWTLGTMAAMATYAIFFFTQELSVFLIASAALVLANVLRFITFGILVRDATKLSEINKVEGLIAAMANVGWLIGPLLAGFIAARMGHPIIFLLAALFTLIALLLFRFIRIPHINHKTADDGTIRGAVNDAREFFSRPELVKCYLIGGGVSIFWSFVFIYVPLMIVRSGIPAYWIGIFLCATALPLIILDYPVGRSADRVGCRPYFIAGYGLLALLSAAAFFAANIYVLMLVLFIASIGAAFLDSTREAYFFKITKRSEEEKFYGPFSTSWDVVGFFGELLGAGILAILAPAYLFLLLAICMTAFALISFSLQEQAGTH